MSYRILTVSQLSAVPTTYTLKDADLIPATIGTSTVGPLLSTVKMKLSDYATFLNSVENTQVIWVSSGNDIYSANSGKVGIGDTTPSHTLDVAGSGAFTGSITAAGGHKSWFGSKVHIGTAQEQSTTDALFEVASAGSTSQGTGMRIVDTAADGSQFIAFSNTLNSKERDAYIEHFNASHTTKSDLKIYNEAAIRLHDAGSANYSVILTGGRVGMGSAVVPLSPLHIKNASDDMLKLESTDSTVYLEMSDNSTTNPGQIGQTNQDMWIKTGGSDKRVTILGTGDIGIGVDSPAAKLEIEDGGTSHNCIVKITADDQSPWGLIIGNDTYSTNETKGLGLFQGNDGKSYISSDYDSGNGTLIFQQTGGKVGIGTIAAPTVTFVVSGTDAMTIPKGTNGQRPTALAGMMRFNTTTSVFEAYNGTTWIGFGDTMDSDGDTFVTAESGTDDDVLHFRTKGLKTAFLRGWGSTATFSPTGSDEINLGTSTSRWKNVYGVGLDISGNAEIDGTFTTLGDVNLGNDSGDTTTLTGALRLANGTVSAPALAFSNDTNTGIYTASNNANAFHLVCNGESQLFIQDGSILPQGVTSSSVTNVNLGSTNKYWNDVYINDLHIKDTGKVDNLNAERVDGLYASNLGTQLNYDTVTGKLQLQNYVKSVLTEVEILQTTISQHETSGSGVDEDNRVRFKSLGVGIDPDAVDGHIRATNDVVFFSSSDIRLKENITSIYDPLNKISQLRGVTFDWTDDHINQYGGVDDYFMRKQDVGVIAQEVEEVLPEAVATRDNGMKAVKYEKLVPLLIEAVKELTEKVERLERGA